MIARYNVRTNYSPEETLRRADEFFGERGLGLKVLESGEHSRVYADEKRRLVLDIAPAYLGSDVGMVSHGVHHAARDFVRILSAFGLMYAGGSRH